MLKLRMLRLERGLTMEQLSRLSGVSRSFISQIENGHRLPRIDMVCYLCHGLGVTPNDLIEEEYYK